MSLDVERLYKLLPAIYRIRDSELGKQLLMSKDRAKDRAQIAQLEAELKNLTDKEEEKASQIRRRLDELQRGPLKVLIDVIAEQARVMEVDINQMYENWFIETCAEWVIPYIGDLLAVRGLHSVRTAVGFSQRARVANTLRYRRRKGTAAVLEQLAYDTTGWRARVVEFFELLGTTQNYNHIRRHNLRTPDLRLTNELELLNTAFDTIAHTVDVRSIAIDRGRHNIPNIGLFLWRLQSYPMIRATARAAKGRPAGCYTFSPLGHDMPLFNRPQTETVITHLAEEINVPGLLRLRPLYDELEARRQALVDSRTPEYTYFDDRPDTKAQPVLEVFLNGSPDPVSPDEILICNLQDWHIPPDKKKYKRIKIDGTYEDVDRTIRVAVDPVLGRLTFPTTVSVNKVQVSYAYGFSGDVGGGPYERQQTLGDTNLAIWKKKVGQGDPNADFKSLDEALTAWADPNDGNKANAIITIIDNASYVEKITIKPADNKFLVIEAMNEKRPTLRLTGTGNIEIIGNHPSADLTLNGLLIEGSIDLQDSLGKLKVMHCTLVPGLSLNENGEPNHPGVASIKAAKSNTSLEIEIDHSIAGALRLPDSMTRLTVSDSIIDASSKVVISCTGTNDKAGPPTVLERTTVLGAVFVKELILANEVIFTRKVIAERIQKGCVRFSYVSINSNTPRRFRCQPDLEISTQISKVRKQGPLSQRARNSIRKRILSWLVPTFTSTTYGHHTYAQLDQACPLLIRTGAEDGSEMGAFHDLFQPQRETNLRTLLNEYLRFGLEAGIFYARQRIKEVNNEG